MMAHAFRLIVGLLVCMGLSPSLAQHGTGHSTTDGAGATLAEQSPAGEEHPRLPVPDKAAVTEAQDLVRQAFAADYGPTGSNPGPLIQKLLVAAEQTDASARRFALLVEAERLAVAAGDPARVMALVDGRAARFDVDGLQERIARLAELLTPKAKGDPAFLVKLYDHAIETANHGLQTDAFQQARNAVDLAASMARLIVAAGKSRKDARLASDGETKLAFTKDLVKKIETQARWWDDYIKATTTLQTNPDDSAANGVVGAYLCLVRDDWDRGLAALAKGDNEALAEIAALEVTARAGGEPDSQRIYMIAGRWWEAAKGSAAKGLGPAMKSHAAALYQSVAGRLADPLDAQLAKTRAAESPTPKPRPGRRPVPPKQPWDATVYITCDNGYSVWLNGELLGRHDDWTKLKQYPVRIRDGDILAIQATDAETGSRTAGLFCCLVLKDGRAWGTGREWRCTTTAPPAGWQTVGEPLAGEAAASEDNIQGSHGNRVRSYGGRITGRFIWSAGPSRTIWLRQVIDLSRFR